MSTVRDGRGVLIELEGAPRLPQGSGPVIAFRRHEFEAVLPCGPCIHHAICRVRTQLEATRFALLEPVIPPEVRIGILTTVSCDYFEERRGRSLTGDGAATGLPTEFLPVEPFAGPLPGPRLVQDRSRRSGKLGPAGPERDRIVIAALEQTRSLRHAADSVGVSLTAMKARVVDLRDRQALPAHIENRIAARDRAHSARRKP